METNEQYKTQEDNHHLPVEYLIKQLLYSIGEDPNRPGLVDTPRRVASAWDEFMNYKPGNHDTTFESVTSNQMVIVHGVKVWSYCEHHLIPFWCSLSMAYIPNQKILGLSKFARIAKKYAHRLQIQEQLVDQIADELKAITGTNDVAVVGRGEHLCMIMRGVETQGQMISSSIDGLFKSNPEARAEFMSFINCKT